MMQESRNDSRRAFLKGSIKAIGALFTAALGAPLIGYYLSPVLARQEAELIEVGEIGDLKPGEPKFIAFTKLQRDAWSFEESTGGVWLATPDGKDLRAFYPRCTHLGCAYSWQQDKQRFYCPCHGGVFDFDGNVVAGPPPRPLDRYEYKVVDGRLYLGKVYRVTV